MKVFVLHHVRDEDGDDEDVKFIGVFSSNEMYGDAIALLRLKPGFIQWPDGFRATAYELDEPHWNDGFVVGKST